MNDQEREIEHKNILAQYSAERAQDIELFKAVILSGQAALKSAILINGGAAVALLAFIGSVFKSSPNSVVITKLSCAMVYFVIGVLSGAVASGTAYISQFFYAYGKKCRCWGHIINGFTWFLVIVSYISFLLGIILVVPEKVGFGRLRN